MRTCPPGVALVVGTGKHPVDPLRSGTGHAERERPTRPHDASGFLKGGSVIGEVLEDLRGDDDVERPVSERKRHRVRDDRGDSGCVGLTGRDHRSHHRGGRRDVVERVVERDDRRSGPDGVEGVAPGTAPEVENGGTTVDRRTRPIDRQHRRARSVRYSSTVRSAVVRHLNRAIPRARPRSPIAAAARGSARTCSIAAAAPTGHPEPPGLRSPHRRRPPPVALHRSSRRAASRRPSPRSPAVRTPRRATGPPQRPNSHTSGRSRRRSGRRGTGRIARGPAGRSCDRLRFPGAGDRRRRGGLLTARSAASPPLRGGNRDPSARRRRSRSS